jgi:hypothetical protein
LGRTDADLDAEDNEGAVEDAGAGPDESILDTIAAVALVQEDDRPFRRRQTPQTANLR